MKAVQKELTIQEKEYLEDLFQSQKGRCVFSNIQLTFEVGSRFRISLDRIDSKVGYKPGNVQFVCAYINKAKQSLNDNDFIEMCRIISEFRIFKNN